MVDWTHRLCRAVALAAALLCLIGPVVVGGPALAESGSAAGSARSASPARTIVAISAGDAHTCAVLDNGTVACWGYNGDGQLGDGTTVNSDDPVLVTGGAMTGRTAVDVSSGATHTCALLDNASIACWGDNDSGQLGNGTTEDSLVPVFVSGGALEGRTVTSVSVGYYFTCALLDNHTVACWGSNDSAQLGRNTSDVAQSSTPIAVGSFAPSGSSGGAAIDSGAHHSCTIRVSGAVTCWGMNSQGQLGTGTDLPSKQTMSVASGGAMVGRTAQEISAGLSHTCAVLDNNALACWGSNSDGQLSSTAPQPSAPSPTLVTGGALEGRTVTDVSAGTFHTCALRDDAAVVCWGGNSSGQSGVDAETSSDVPVLVSGSALSGRTATAVSAGGTHTCAVLDNGTAACWGANNLGQLGNGTTSASSFPPVLVTGGALLPMHVLTVARSGTGSGTVTGGAIACGTTCETSLRQGSSVTLTATPAAGSDFAGWSGAGCTGTGNCVVSMTQARTVTARFTLKSYQLVVVRQGAGTGSVTSTPAGIRCGSTCTVSRTHGSSVTLRAVASAGSTFTGWSGSGCTGTGSCVVSMTQARSVTATFTLTTFTLTVQRSGTGTGQVTSMPAGISCGSTCTKAFAVGTIVTLTASAGSTSTFTGWSGSGCSGKGTCTVTMSQAKSVTATFKKR